MRTKITLAGLGFCLALASSVSADTFQDFASTGLYNASRVGYFEVSSVDNVPLTSAAGTGHIVSNASLSNVLTTVTLTNDMQPESLRELVIFQEDASGTNLSVAYSITAVLWDGRVLTFTETLTGDSSFVLSHPVAKINSVAYTPANSATSDAVRIGYRGFYFAGAFPVSASDIIAESVNGDGVTTAGTVPQAGFYLPNSVSAGQRVHVGIRTSTTSERFQLNYRKGQAVTETY